MLEPGVLQAFAPHAKTLYADILQRHHVGAALAHRSVLGAAHGHSGCFTFHESRRTFGSNERVCSPAGTLIVCRD